MQRRLFGDVHAEVATTLMNFAVLYVGRSDYAKARTMVQQVVDIWTKLAGPSHPLALASRGNLGVIEREQGDYAAARITLQSALDDYRKQPASAARQAYCLDQSGILLHYEGKPAEALELHHEAETLRASVEQLGPVENAAGLIALSLDGTPSGHAQDARRCPSESTSSNCVNWPHSNFKLSSMCALEYDAICTLRARPDLA